ncbi:MAG: hypothetical protein Q4B77_03315 [Coriobacteriaceae bacterium]|nr:hypothetical protein [Coriobacteriaceae bacterium]
MDATPSLHAAWRANRTRTLIAGAGVTAALFASVLFPVPARAITTETEATLTETQKKVEQTAAAFDKANKALEDLQEQVAKNEARIAELESKLPEAQDRASRAMRDIYKKRKDSNFLMSFVMGTESLDSLISSMKYVDQIKDANIEALEDLNAVQTELEAEKTKLNAAKVKAESEHKAASDALADAQKLRESAQAKADAEAAAELAALQEAAKQAAQGGEPTGPVATPDNGEVNWSTDEAAFIAEWTSRIDAYLAGSPLEGQGVTFATAAWKYGVDPRFSPAISNTESSKGRHCFLPHNAWGWGSSSWDSWEEAIDDHVAGLARGYGYTISVAGAKKYCPPNWFNWYNNTLSEMNKI